MQLIQTLSPQKTKHDTDDDMILFRRYHETKVFNEDGKLIKTDLKLRNELALRNQKLVLFTIAKFFYHKQLTKEVKEDLYQEGNIGLFNAIDNYNPTMGFKFSTYCCWWTKQACSNYLLEQGTELTVPAHVRTAQNKITKNLRASKQPEFTMRDLDNSLAPETYGVTEKMIECIKAAMKTKWVHSLYEPAWSASDGDMTLEDTIPDKALSEEKFDITLLTTAAKRALSSLSERERLILLLRYNVIQAIPAKEVNSSDC